jgi:hypothetical protein
LSDHLRRPSIFSTIVDREGRHMEKTEDIPKGQRRWVDVDLRTSRFHNVDLSGSTIRGAFLVDVDLDGIVERLTVNGVDVSAYVESQLDERFPVRRRIRAGELADLRAAWDELEATWATTSERAQQLGEEVLHRRVDDEWSFVETLRHLVFVTDAWISRCVLGEATPYDPMGLLITDAPASLVDACGLDRSAAPSFAEVLEVRRRRQTTVRELLADLTPDQLGQPCPRNPAPGHPANTTVVPVRGCLQVVLREELAHHRFAVRDLDRLATPSP